LSVACLALILFLAAGATHVPASMWPVPAADGSLRIRPNGFRCFRAFRLGIPSPLVRCVQ